MREKAFEPRAIYPCLMYRVRRFKPEDLDIVMDIVSRSINEHYKPELFIKSFESFPEGFLVVLDSNKNKIIGVVVSIPTHDNALRILILAIDMAYRRRRIGTQLLNILKRLCITHNFKKITLEVRVDNLPAIEFYKRNGFIVKGVIPNYYTDGSSGYLMEKTLY